MAINVLKCVSVAISVNVGASVDTEDEVVDVADTQAGDG